MNVLVLSHLLPTPARPYCGVFVVEQLKALRQLGVAAVPLCPTPWAPPGLQFMGRVRECASVPQETGIEGFRIRYPRVLAPGGRWFAAYGWLYYLSCRRLIGRLLREHRIELIHAHTIMPCGYAAALLAREFKLPVVATLHGSDVRDYPREGRGIPAATRWALCHVPELIAVSGEIEAQARRLAPACGRSRVIHNGADPTLFRPHDQSDARRQLDVPRDRKVVVFVGSLERIKGVDVLLRAFAHLAAEVRAGALVYLIGGGEQRQQLERLAGELGIAQQVRFMGAQPYPSVPLWLSAADVLCLPSHGEGLPTILPESMLCRVPIVASAVGGIPEIIKHRETGVLVPPGDDVALSGALAELLSGDPGLATTIVDNAERYARAHLTWEANARSTLAVYQQALDAARERAGSARANQLQTKAQAMAEPSSGRKHA